jgi:hypothetical protein
LTRSSAYGRHTSCACGFATSLRPPWYARPVGQRAPVVPVEPEPSPSPPEREPSRTQRIAATIALVGLLEILSTVLLHAFGLLPGPEPGPMWVVALLEVLLLLWAGLVTV